jgi:hypothetical protein
MLFMLVSRAKPGTKREELVDRFSRDVHPETWDLIRRGELSHVLYKVGDEPGFFAILNATSVEEAKSLLERSEARLDLFDLEIHPVNLFPHFK